LFYGGEEGKRENDGGVNPTKIYFKHICKYYTVFLCTTMIYLKIINIKEAN
jgi:hypothetical protein